MCDLETSKIEAALAHVGLFCQKIVKIVKFTPYPLPLCTVATSGFCVRVFGCHNNIPIGLLMFYFNQISEIQFLILGGFPV